MVAGDKRRRARPPAPADARAPGSCSRPCSSCSRLWPRPPPRGPVAAGRIRVRRLRVPRAASCAGSTPCAVGGAGRGARHWRWPAAAPGACVTSRAARSHAPALGSRVPATCRMREPHWPRRLTRCSAGPALRNVGRCSMAASSSDAPLPVLPPAPRATESRAAPSVGPAVVLARGLQTNSWPQSR